jgi:hypothetical protein
VHRILAAVAVPIAMSIGPCLRVAFEEAGNALRNSDTVAEARAALDELAQEGVEGEAVQRGFCAVATDVVNDPENVPPDASGWAEIIADEAQYQLFGLSFDAVRDKAEEFAAGAELWSYNPAAAQRYANACKLFSFP